MRNIFSKRQRVVGAQLILALLLFGAYVPTGFMPANGTPFLVELCPMASPLPVAMSVRMPMPPHHHHHPAGEHRHENDCPFGSVPGAGPIGHMAAAPALSSSSAQILVYSAPPVIRRAERAHPPRGPPTPA